MLTAVIFCGSDGEAGRPSAPGVMVVRVTPTLKNSASGSNADAGARSFGFCSNAASVNLYSCVAPVLDGPCVVAIKHQRSFEHPLRRAVILLAISEDVGVAPLFGAHAARSADEGGEVIRRRLEPPEVFDSQDFGVIRRRPLPGRERVMINGARPAVAAPAPLARDQFTPLVIQAARRQTLPCAAPHFDLTPRDHLAPLAHFF
jgi:hypothetical protein